jgi:L-cysteine S-thiosulfotransferase
MKKKVFFHIAWVGAFATVVVAAGCATMGGKPPKWQSQAIPESQGVVKEVDGKRAQERYRWGGFGRDKNNYEKWPTHAYDSPAYFPPKTAQMPAGMKGDPQKGHAIMKNRRKGPCTACHVIPDATVWPIGNVGPDLRTVGDRNLADSYLYQIVYDPRVIFGKDSPMAPFGAAGILTEEEIVHVVAYLQSLKGNPPGTPPKVTDDPQWDPYTRQVVKPEYGDPFDPTANPALTLTDSIAVPLWNKAGSKGKSCASCHGIIDTADDKRSLGVIDKMVGVATRYPKWFGQHRRMMSIEDFLAVHAPETTGHPMPSQGEENKTMSILVKMQSNGMPYKIDLKNRNVKAAIERGKEIFHRPVGQRGQKCADCHTTRGGAHKFLGGRFLGDVEKDPLVNHPYYRTAQARLWDIRMRFQWCMLPLKTNYLAGDSPEYADLETYIVAQQTKRGDQVEVPRISH